VLANLLRPVVVPVYRFLGADPAMFAGTILACDMGGGALAQELTADPEAALLGGVLCGSMLGATIVFTIPVAMGILRKEDQPAMAKGILAGIVTIPVGVFVGGLVAGIPVMKVLRNLVPIVVIAVLIALGLWKAEKWMVKGFAFFGKGVVAVITAGLAAAIVEELTGFVIIPGMAPLEEGFLTVGAIAIVLAGAFPLVWVVTRVLKKPLLRVGKWLGINDTAAGGLVATLANSIATFNMVEQMDNRGKVVNIAFAVSAAFVFGDHMGFTAGFAPEMLPAVIAGKLAGGVSAVAVALWLTRKKMA
jgi:ethanolamine transporter